MVGEITKSNAKPVGLLQPLCLYGCGRKRSPQPTADVGKRLLGSKGSFNTLRIMGEGFKSL